MRDESSAREDTVRALLLGIGVAVLVLGLFTVGCATKYVSLYPTDDSKRHFDQLDFNPEEYAFFTTGPDVAPDALLIIENKYLGDFDSSGWKLRDKKQMIEVLKGLQAKASEAKKFGLAVRGPDGEVMGHMFTTFRKGKVFVDTKEGTFSVATPSMLETGTMKRPTCSISICQ